MPVYSACMACGSPPARNAELIFLNFLPKVDCHHLTIAADDIYSLDAAHAAR